MRQLDGMRILFDPNALEYTEERLFPVSKHRSRRIHKKLVKRFGGEYRRKPAIFKFGGTIIAHPSFKDTIDRMIAQEVVIT